MKKYPEILDTMKSRKLPYFGHIMRDNERYYLNCKRGPGKKKDLVARKSETMVQIVVERIVLVRDE